MIKNIDTKEAYDEDRCIEAEFGYDDSKDAIFAIYEELFDGNENLDTERIYKAMRYLLWYHDMAPQYKNITNQRYTDIFAVSPNDVDKAVAEEAKYIKGCLQEVLDEL